MDVFARDKEQNRQIAIVANAVGVVLTSGVLVSIGIDPAKMVVAFGYNVLQIAQAAVFAWTAYGIQKREFR